MPQVTKWVKEEYTMKQQVTNDKGRFKGRVSASLSRMSKMGVGRRVLHASCEDALFCRFKEHRARGLKVRGYWLRGMMKKLVKEHLGDGVAMSFRASKKWLQLWCHRYYFPNPRLCVFSIFFAHMTFMPKPCPSQGYCMIITAHNIFLQVFSVVDKSQQQEGH